MSFIVNLLVNKAYLGKWNSVFDLVVILNRFATNYLVGSHRAYPPNVG